MKQKSKEISYPGNYSTVIILGFLGLTKSGKYSSLEIKHEHFLNESIKAFMCLSSNISRVQNTMILQYEFPGYHFNMQ
jgi:hypothetical protein